MNKTIGKSGVDWSKAPEGTTHYKHSIFYRQHAGVWEYHNNYWLESSNIDSWFNDAVSKEEDLEMNKKEVLKQVSCIEDLEVGMFLRWRGYEDRIYLVIQPNKIISLNVFDQYVYGCSGWSKDNFYDSEWSYTYNGEYTPIVKEVVETEAERKIKELEATIALAQKQLEEYKEMK